MQSSQSLFLHLIPGQEVQMVIQDCLLMND